MTSRKRCLTKSSAQYPRSGGVVDMEMDCVICRSRLYVPESSFDSVLASLQQGGAALLVCPVGHAQLVSKKKWAIGTGTTASKVEGGQFAL